MSRIIETRSLDSGNFSLCHGHFGNADCLLSASRILGESSSCRGLSDFALDAFRAFERPSQHWPSGTFNSVPDPTLLLGDAGIGFFFLRLHNPNLESVLFVRAGAADKRRASRYTADELRREFAGRYVRRTLSGFERVAGETVEVITDTVRPGSEILVAFDLIRAHIARQQDAERRDLLAAIAELDDSHFEVARYPANGSEELLAAIAQPRAPIRDLAFSLKHGSRLVQLAPMVHFLVPGVEEGGGVLIFKIGEEVQQLTLERFPFLVASLLQQELATDELIRAVTEVSDEAIPPEQIRAAVEGLLASWANCSFLRSRVVDVHAAATS
jgi:hypothetical protein